MRKNDVYFFDNPPTILSYSSCVGQKEGEGPLGDSFDVVGSDDHFGQETWEQAEKTMVQTSLNGALTKARLDAGEVGCVLGGDLLNQCISTSYAVRELKTRFFGLYGACSTMAESLILGSTLISGGFEGKVLCTASSHFCSAERQYRYPLQYGGQRTPTAQWTATASGSVLLSADGGGKVSVTRAMGGRIYDPGVTDAANMGAAMAQSAYETLRGYFATTAEDPASYDLIVTGDLATVGRDIVLELAKDDGISFDGKYTDCGLMLFDRETQDVHSGASGCGCSAAVLCGYILPEMEKGNLRRVLFCGTGALLSPIATSQGESIPGICHLVCLEVL
ncbi:MAG: stage V sporulation protein AD [Clostridiaceae bacterium]|nr:stage V sporulation protein AD [Clostridiaceae bacterium]